MLTIYDVAKRAGVSKSTVSLVLNNSSLVKETTRVKVQKAIDELHYVPNESARSMLSHKTHNFGVLEVSELQSYGKSDFSHETGTYALAITSGILQGLADTDYGLITERWTVGSELPRLFKKNCIDGIFIVGTIFDEAILEEIRKTKLPAVVVGKAIEGISSIYSDAGSGAELSMRYLYAKGHKHVCFINAPAPFSSARSREEAIIKLYDELKIPQEDRHIISSPHNSGEGGLLAMEEILKEGIPFDGIAVANDMMAMGVVRFCYNHHLRIPDDVSLITYDNSVLSSYCSPALTAVDINEELSGRFAAKEMINRIEHPSEQAVKVCVPLTLVERDSVLDRNKH